jgi:cbb3-type cytochrome oxidase subunit 3
VSLHAVGGPYTCWTDLNKGCWFTSDKVRLLVNFIPPWLIIVIILVLYARLYHLIYTAHNRFISFNDEASPHTLEPETESVSSTRRIGRPSMTMNMSTDDMESKRQGGSNPGRTHVRGPSPVLKKMAYQMMMYPLVYVLIWTCPTTIRIYQSVTGKPAPFGIATVDKVYAVSAPLSAPCILIVSRLASSYKGLPMRSSMALMKRLLVAGAKSSR